MYLPLLSLLHECLTTPLISNENQDFPHNPADKNVFENLANQDHLPEIIAELGRIERVSLSVFYSYCSLFLATSMDQAWELAEGIIEKIVSAEKSWYMLIARLLF